MCNIEDLAVFCERVGDVECRNYSFYLQPRMTKQGTPLAFTPKRATTDGRLRQSLEASIDCYFADASNSIRLALVKFEIWVKPGIEHSVRDMEKLFDDLYDFILPQIPTAKSENAIEQTHEEGDPDQQRVRQLTKAMPQILLMQIECDGRVSDDQYLETITNLADRCLETVCEYNAA